MAERLRLINPKAEIEAVKMFYQEDCSEELLAGDPDFVVDAIDQFTAKCHLIATCFKREIPLVSSMGAAGRWDPTQITVVDLNKTNTDKMASNVSGYCGRNMGFPVERKPGDSAVFSTGPQPPHDLAYEEGTASSVYALRGTDCSPATAARIDGSASFVTGTFGLVAASVVVRQLSTVNEEVAS